MWTFMKLGLLTVFSFLFFACSQSETDTSDVNRSELISKKDGMFNVKDYFFPSDSIDPYIYVYADENKPLDEKIFRIYTLKTADKHQLVVEKFNASFRITEGFTYDLDDFLNVIDHMVVDRDALKRKAHLTSSALFLSDTTTKAVFVSDFPAHVEPYTAIYKSTKMYKSRIDDYEVLERKTEAIEVNNEIVLSFVDTESKDGEAKGVNVTEVYAEGLGLTEWYTENKSIHYKLKRILTNDWWKEHAQGPSVKM
jgi:hypothetical protein